MGATGTSGAELPDPPTPRNQPETVVRGVLAVVLAAASLVVTVILTVDWTRSDINGCADSGPSTTRRVVCWLVIALIAVGPAVLAAVPVSIVARTRAGRWITISGMVILGVLGAGTGALIGQFCTQ